jgi:metal-responsive CopG/Arc/MetJ family transcriptional regulator
MPSDPSKRLQLIVDETLKPRIDRALKPGENRSDFIRKAIETELRKRERKR